MKYYNTRDVCDILGYTMQALHYHIRTKKIPVKKDSKGFYMVRKEDVDKILEKRQKERNSRLSKFNIGNCVTIRRTINYGYAMLSGKIIKIEEDKMILKI